MISNLHQMNFLVKVELKIWRKSEGSQDLCGWYPCEKKNALEWVWHFVCLFSLSHLLICKDGKCKKPNREQWIKDRKARHSLNPGETAVGVHSLSRRRVAGLFCKISLFAWFLPRSQVNLLPARLKNMRTGIFFYTPSAPPKTSPISLLNAVLRTP